MYYFIRSSLFSPFLFLFFSCIDYFVSIVLLLAILIDLLLHAIVRKNYDPTIREVLLPSSGNASDYVAHLYIKYPKLHGNNRTCSRGFLMQKQRVGIPFISQNPRMNERYLRSYHKLGGT